MMMYFPSLIVFAVCLPILCCGYTVFYCVPFPLFYRNIDP